MSAEHLLRDGLALGLLLLVSFAGWRRRRQVGRLVEALEHDAEVQYEVHRVATWWWVVNLPLCFAVFIGLPQVWAELGLFYTLLLSLYANFSTDYGAMSAAIAARQTQRRAPVSTCRHCREAA